MGEELVIEATTLGGIKGKSKIEEAPNNPELIAKSIPRCLKNKIKKINPYLIKLFLLLFLI